MQPFIEITIISILLSVAIVGLSRVFTKPEEVRKVKKEMEFFRKKSSEAQKQKDQAAVKRYTSLMMKSSQKQMKLSMKSMMVSMIIVIFAFGYLHAEYDGFDVALQTPAELVSEGAGLTGLFSYKQVNQSLEVSPDKQTFILGGETHKLGEFIYYKQAYWQLSVIDENKAHMEMFAVKTPFTIPFLGNYLSWFWLYILITLPATIILRKLLGLD